MAELLDHDHVDVCAAIKILIYRMNLSLSATINVPALASPLCA